MTKTQDLIPMGVLERAAAVMRVLAHPHRLRMCELLLSGEVSVGELAEHLGLPQNAVSQHLSILRAHGVVARERDGKAAYYRVVHPSAGWLLSCIRRHARGGRRAQQEL